MSPCWCPTLYLFFHQFISVVVQFENFLAIYISVVVSIQNHGLHNGTQRPQKILLFSFKFLLLCIIVWGISSHSEQTILDISCWMLNIEQKKHGILDIILSMGYGLWLTMLQVAGSANSFNLRPWISVFQRFSFDSFGYDNTHSVIGGNDNSCYWCRLTPNIWHQIQYIAPLWMK